MLSEKMRVVKLRNYYSLLVFIRLFALFSIILTFFVRGTAGGTTTTTAAGGAWKYPVVRRDESVVDDYHGTKIADPYRWLEDPDSEETEAFIAAQNNLTKMYLEGASFRNEIRTQLTCLWNFPQRGVPKKRGDKYFHLANSGLKNQWVLMVQDRLDGKPRVFLDPNALSASGAVSIQSSAFSEDGALFAYALSQSGSDWVTIHIRNVSSGKDFSEVLHHSKFPSIAWTHDHLGFFYRRFQSTYNESGRETGAVEGQKVYYHSVGTWQGTDELILEFPDMPKLWLFAEVSDDGDYLVVSTYEVKDEHLVYYAPLRDWGRRRGMKSRGVSLLPINTLPASFAYVTNDGPQFYFLTDLDAPNKRLVRIELGKSKDPKDWTTVIPEGSHHVLKSVVPMKELIFLSYLKDVKGALEVRHLTNGSLIRQFPLQIGTISSVTGKRRQSLFFFELTTFTSPGLIYKVDLNQTAAELKAELFHESKSNLDSSSIQVDQVFYRSKDGTKIPMYILHRKGLEKNGSAPAYLYSYGGFRENVEPSYSIQNLVFVQHFHGVVAIPSIRGGGEYGKEWWTGGRLLKKQNCFDDFAAAAEYLISAKYTSPSKLVIAGASNGGLLVGATLNQRPELFGAAVPDVGVMDMLRFQKFTGGSYWCGEYGCSDDEDKFHFQNLLSYSPLHNIRLPQNDSIEQYPAVLVRTGDHDDRVVPSHSYKFIAELQSRIGRSERQTNPLLIRIDKEGGHGIGKPTSKLIEDVVDEFSFYVRSMNYTFYA